MSPDRLLNTQSAQKVWEEDQATLPEMTDEQGLRITRLAEGQANLEEASEPGVSFILRVEQLMKEGWEVPPVATAPPD